MATPKYTPSSKPLARKLFIKPGMSVAAVNAPRDYGKLLGPLPEGAKIVARPPADFVHVFARNQAEVAAAWPKIAGKLGDETVLWLSYPKSGALGTDLTRDKGWDPVQAAGWGPVSQVAVDDTWSALRFKRGARRR